MHHSFSCKLSSILQRLLVPGCSILKSVEGQDSVPQAYCLSAMSVLSFPKILLATLPLVAPAQNVIASAYEILPRQSNPTSLPGNWSLAGCFTDVSTARTLAATATINSNMTVENCIAFCDAGGFIFAGVEFGQECYCDSTIQIPGARAQQSDCSEPCAGNPSEFCGASGRLTIFASGAPSPRIANAPKTGWTYQGCFTDNTANRTLPVPINVPIGVTAETCTAACQSAAAFTHAGLENGHECWCGNITNSIAQHVSDDDCRAICGADHAEYCGNANRVAVYEFTAEGQAPPPPQTCAGDISNFTLLAVFNNPPVGSSAQVKIRAVLVELVPNTFWTLLSSCATCCSDWPSFSLENSVFLPRSASNPTQSMTSIGASDGESPSFVASSPPFPGAQAYCAAETTTASDDTDLLLSFGGKTDSWSLCTNTTANANGRVDLVFAPVTNHPHYAFSSCNAVTVKLIQG
ncbi:WSC domain-containing protein [Favolaschia claudopus]|uniref:WSC domain-containing protein n=1 Tax=Favolaschia claudopus TaxID=2862362 RepID=A0AAW0C9K8_9AGAR